MMRYFLVTFHETDGNDTTVFDAVVGIEPMRDADIDHAACLGSDCETCKDAAFRKVGEAIAKRLDADGRPYSEDGGYGFFFDCVETCPEDCDGHGGICMRDAEGFETRDAAERDQEACYYRSRFFCE